MSQTKRRFADDDPDSDEEPVFHGGQGKQLRHMGKQLRRSASDDDDDDSEDERPSHQQFRGQGGKQLHRMRPAESEDDDDDDEEEEEVVQVQPVPRGGGKSLFRPPPQEEDDDDDDDEEEEEEPLRIVPRGGKSLVRMRPPEEEEEDDEEEEKEEEGPIQPRGEGKSLMGMQQRGRGKQLRPSVQEEEEESEEHDDIDFEDNDEPPVVVQRPAGGGKQLHRPPPPKSESDFEDDGNDDDDDDDDDDDAMEIDEESEEEFKKPAERPSPGRGKTLRQPAAVKPKPPPRKATPARAAKKVQEPEDMEESDESSDDERELDMETFDTQELVQGEEDQKYLDSLPELEREAILGERFEKLKSAADMKKALRESKRKEREERKLAQKQSDKKKPARKAPAKKKADTSGDAALATKLDTTRESTRNRDAAGKKGKKDAARAQLRELKSQQKEDEESAEESDLDFGSDADDDSASDYEEEEVKMKPWQQKKKAQKITSRLHSYAERLEASDEEMNDVSLKAPVVEAELEDYLKITLPRRRLARWCNEPFFDQAVLGCFVRLFIGESDDRKKCYRLCEIVGVEKSKSEYKFPTTTSHEKPITTSKALRLKFGKNEKSFPMYLVSDSRPTEEDVRKYVAVQKASRQEVFGRREATRLRKKQDELVNNYTYTQADIEKNVAERKKSGRALTNLGLEQTRVAVALQAAHSALYDAKRRLEDAKRSHLEAPDDSEELKNAIEEAEDALAEAKAGLEEKKEEEKRILAVVGKRKKKLSRRQKDQNWAKVNERAAKINQNADFESYKDQQAKKEAEAKSGSEPRFNPYARRKVKPKILWEVGQKEEKKDDDATNAVDNETREDAGTIEATKDNQVMNDVPQEDVLASQKAAFLGERHQFSIDDEALAPDATTILGINRKKHKGTPLRKGLSLAQYQERKAAGTL